MATIQSAGTLTNRERQVESTYNDPDIGLIPVLQRQIDQAIIDRNKVNNDLLASQAQLNTLKDALSTIRNSNISTSDIPQIPNFEIQPRSSGGRIYPTAIPLGIYAIPASLNVDEANNWISTAKTVINDIKTVLEPQIKSSPAFAVEEAGIVKPALNAGAIALVFDRTFGAKASALQVTIDMLTNKIEAYKKSIVTTQLAIETQAQIVVDNSELFDIAEKRLKDLNAEMTELRLQYQSAMASASDVDAQSAQTALQLQLANDPIYQQALIEKQLAEQEIASSDLQAKIDAETALKTAQIQAEADIAKARVLAEAEAQTATATATTEAQKESSKKTLWVILAIVFAIIVLSVTAYFIWGRD